MAEACGEWLRHRIIDRERRMRRWRVVTIALLAATACALSLVYRPAVLFVWNVSASSPRGLYRVERNAKVRRGDIVIARFPERFSELAAKRNYLPQGVPLVKRVAAVAGDRVCASGQAISIDGRIAAKRRRFDALRRPLPTWQGCVDLRSRDLFLLGEDPWSFDGRYFGVTHSSEVVGRGVLIWHE